MSEYKAFFNFGKYRMHATFWARDDNEARKYLRKHYLYAEIISLQTL